MYYISLLLLRVFFNNLMFLFNIFKNDFYLQIRNGSTIVDQLKNMVILPKCMTIDPTSNNLI